MSKEVFQRIRGMISRLREIASSKELDDAQRAILRTDIGQLEGLARKFRSKTMSQINRKELQASLVKLAEDLLRVFGSEK